MVEVRSSFSPLAHWGSVERLFPVRHACPPRQRPIRKKCLRSNYQQVKCLLFMALTHVLPLALLSFAAHAQDSQASALNEVTSNVDLDTSLDHEELQMLAQDRKRHPSRYATIQLPKDDVNEDGKDDSTDKKRGEPFQASSDDLKQQGGLLVDAPLEFATEDGLAAAEKSPKVAGSAFAEIDSNAVPQVNMDATIGVANFRLASEEQLNGRLQKLLSQSAVDKEFLQQKIAQLESDLHKAVEQKQLLKGDALVKLSAEDAETSQQTARADAAEKKLRKADHDICVGQKTVTWLKERLNSLLAHLRHVMNIDKTLQQELVEKSSSARSLKYRLAAMKRDAEAQHSVPKKVVAGLQKVEADKASEDARMDALTRQNRLLQERLLSLGKRDQVLEKENRFLRGQLREKNGQAAGSQKELEQVKAALAEAQSSNVQVQSKYASELLNTVETQSEDADSLKSVVTAAAAGGEHGAASPETTSDEDTGSEAASSLMELRRDSSRMTVALGGHVPVELTDEGQSAVKESVGHEDERLAELSRLNEMLQGAKNRTHQAPATIQANSKESPSLQ